jgi:hypothetical protein
MCHDLTAAARDRHAVPIDDDLQGRKFVGAATRTLKELPLASVQSPVLPNITEDRLP